MERTKQLVAVDTWQRKAHFEFFKNFAEPFFGLTAEIDIADTQTWCKQQGYSFYLFYLHKLAKAVNQLPAFCYRLEGSPGNEQVVQWSAIDISATVDRPDGTFGFSRISYHPEFAQFAAAAVSEITRVRARTDLEPSLGPDNVIHFSALPWLRFSGLSHARHFPAADSSPKLSVGRVTQIPALNAEHGLSVQTVMPVSVHGHHALLDGADIGQLLEKFSALLRDERY